MNVSLTDELETVIEEKVKSGLYNNASEVVRDALRRAFCQPTSLNLDQDTPELAALVHDGRNSRHTLHRKGDARKLLDRFRTTVALMTVQRSERFDTDLERQFRWYLLEPDLDPADAVALAARFADAVDAGLAALAHNPEIGRRRFGTFPDLAGTRSWRIRKPFHRFVIFYRIEDEALFAERLLEGHSRLAGDS